MNNHKYGAEPKVIDGIKFDSKAESKRYMELKLLEKAGKISHLILQPMFKLTSNKYIICKYYADFAYINEEGERIVEDVKGYSKGVAHQLFMIKWKLAYAQYGKKIDRWFRIYSDQVVEGLDKRKGKR